MTKQATWRQPTWTTAVLSAAFLIEVVFPAGNVTAVDPAPAGPASGSPTTVRLEQQEVSYGVASWSVSVVAQSSPFKAEPSLARGKIVRGVLQFRGNSSNSIAFLWHRTAGKLFLDLNRNRDLTDDVGGVLSAREPVSISYQTFTNINLPFNTPSGNRQIRVDLSLWDYGSRPSCIAAVRSFWQGRVTLQDQEWQVGIVENLGNKPSSFDGGYILMRPWPERTKPFSTSSGSRDTFPFSRQLFVGNRAYQLDWTNEPPGGDSRFDLRFTEQQPALGELKISGAYVQRVILKGDPYLVVADKPPATVKVPVGTYAQARVWLKAGDTEAYHDSDPASGDMQIVVGEQKPATLTAGGPLANAVSLNRHGKQLSLNYRLVGVGGEAYRLLRQDPARPPEFAIYRGDKKIASGKFEFG